MTWGSVSYEDEEGQARAKERALDWWWEDDDDDDMSIGEVLRLRATITATITAAIAGEEGEGTAFFEKEFHGGFWRNRKW